MTIERKLEAVKRLLAEAKAEGNAVLVKFYTEKLEGLEKLATPELTTFLVCARNKETNEIVVREYVAKTAKEAKTDFQDNGYAVRFVTTEENFDTDCEAYNNKIEKQVAKRAIMKEVRTLA